MLFLISPAGGRIAEIYGVIYFINERRFVTATQRRWQMEQRAQINQQKVRVCLFRWPSSRAAACISYECRRRRMNFAVDPKQPQRSSEATDERHLTFCIRARSAPLSHSLARGAENNFISSRVHGNCRVVYERARVTKEKRHRDRRRERKKTGSRRSFLFFSVYLLKRTPLIDQIEPCERTGDFSIFIRRILIYWVQDKQEARHRAYTSIATHCGRPVTFIAGVDFACERFCCCSSDKVGQSPAQIELCTHFG